MESGEGMTVSIELIRQKILDKAMRGELVEQSPNDEPVESLLKRIEKEKEELIKEKKIKKRKPLPPIRDDETPYKLPLGWKWVRYADIVELINGRAYKRHELLDEEEGNTPVLRVGNFFTNQSWYYSDLELDEDKYANNGDLLYAWSASFGPKIWDGGKVIYHYHIWKVNIYGGIDKEFLYYLLLKDVHDIKDITTGSTMVHVTKANMEKRILPLPPLNEQKRIAKKIKTLFNLCDKWEKEVEKQQKYLIALREKVLDDAIKGLLVEQNENDEPAEALLEKIKKEKQKLIKEKKIRRSKPLPPINEDEIPYKLPLGWQWVRLGSYTHINMGQSPPSTSYNDSGDGMPFYQGKSDFGKMFPTPTKWCTEPKKIASKNDILISVRAPVGQVNICQEESCIGRGLASIKTIVGDYLYLFYVLKAKEKEIEEKGTGTTFKSINAQTLNDLLIPIPPLNEQKRIVEKIENAFTYIDKLESQLIIPK